MTLNTVEVFCERKLDFVTTPIKLVVCPECSASVKKYGIDGLNVNAFWWDDHKNGDGPMLVCPCGEQFFGEHR